MKNPLLVVGASARAAVQSAVRAGFTPWCFDLFADVDTRACGPTQKVGDYPRGLLAAIASLDEVPDAPWMYTGALENYPALIEALASKRQLWGNGGEVLRQARDVRRLQSVAQEVGLAMPAMVEYCHQEGDWLRKPYRSAAGNHIAIQTLPSLLAGEVSRARGFPPTSPSPDFYWQQRIIGQPISAAFCSLESEVRLLGMAAQLIGDDGSGGWWNTCNWSGANDFQFAGAIAPLELPDDIANQFAILGDCIAKNFGLCGLFGIDAMFDGETLWPLEINPRYTASMESFERFSGESLVGLHAAAFGSKPHRFAMAAPTPCPSPPAPLPRSTGGEERQVFEKKFESDNLVGKAIVYCRDGDAELTVTESALQWMLPQNAAAPWPVIADIPAPGTVISPGQPIATVFAEGTSTEQVIAALKARTRELRQTLAANP